MIKNRVPVNALLLSILSGMFFLALSVVLWGANRGLGFGDEGIYILASRYPDEIQQNVSAIFAFTGHLFAIANYNPVAFRVLGVVAVLLSAVVFWYGFQKLLIKLQPEAANIKYLKYCSLLFIVTGSILHYQFSYLTPSYYTLTAVVVNFFAGCIALGLSLLGKEKKSQSAGIFFVAGMVFGLTLFFKFPTAVPLFCCAVAIIFLQNDITLGARVRSVIAILLGFVAWLAIYFTFERAPKDTLEMFRAGWSLYQTLGFHNPIDKLLVYPKDLSVLIYTAVFEFWPCYFIIFVCSVIGLINNKYYNYQELFRLRYAVVWSVIVIALMMSFNSGVVVNVPERFVTSPVDGRTRPYIAFQLGWIFLLSALYLFCLHRSGLKIFCFDKTSVFFLFLLLMPVAGSFGTSNPIYNVIQFYAVPWFGAIFLLAVLIVLRCGFNPALLMVVVLSISAYVSNHVAQGSLLMPAQVKPLNLFDQSVPTSVGSPPHILNLDLTTHNVITQLSLAAKASGFKGGDDIIAFSEIPGLVYALGGRSPGHPVYPCCYNERPNDYSKMALTFSDVARLKKAYVLLNMESVDNIHSILDSVGINFPHDYQVLTKVHGLGVNFTLYKPNGL